MWTWGFAALGLVIALVAVAWVRRLSRRLDTLNQAYWELRYDYTRLRAQLARLDPEEADAASAPPPQPPAEPSVSFVPLATIRKKNT